MKCPKCEGAAEIVYTPEFYPKLPFELVCYECGWFDFQRHASREKAVLAIDAINQAV